MSTPKARRIAITGGPCSGKTTLVRLLAEAGYPTVREAAIDEIAALEEELGGREAQRAFRRDKPIEFQLRLVERQVKNERAACPRTGGPVFLDRSVLDGIAYLEEDGLTIPSELERAAREGTPDVAFILDTLSDFDLRRETGRTSDRERSLRLRDRIEAVYRRYGVPLHRLPDCSPAERFERVLATLGEPAAPTPPLVLVVLAAGFATRLYPLTRDRAKPLLDVGGRAVLSHVLDRAAALNGVAGCVVVTNARFHDQFVEWRAQYESDVPISLLNDGATENENRLGGIADLALGLQEAQRQCPGADVLVLAGDNLIEEDLSEFLAYFRRLRAPLLLCRRISGGIPPSRHGEVLVDSTGRVTRFREKPADPESELAATCFYFLPADTTPQLERYLASGGDSDAPGHFLAWLVPQREVHARVLKGRTFDIGNLESLERARIEYDKR